MAIFKETKRPSKEMQATIAEQLNLKVSTVANFFMNARRRAIDKYTDDSALSDPSSPSSGMMDDMVPNWGPSGCWLRSGHPDF